MRERGLVGEERKGEEEGGFTVILSRCKSMPFHYMST